MTLRRTLLTMAAAAAAGATLVALLAAYATPSMALALDWVATCF